MTHKRLKSVLSLSFILFIQFLSAQVIITIPSANTFSTVANLERRKPLGTFFGYERSAFIFKHSEIGQYGQINSISFFCDSINNPGNAPVNVYMKEITDSVFVTSSTVATEESGAQLVFSGTISNAAFTKGQWSTIIFSTPFVHATSRPLEVIIETNAGGTGNESVSLGKSFYHHTSPGFLTFQYWSSDNTPPINTGIRTINRPNVQFNLTPLTVCSGLLNAGIVSSSVDTTCSQVSLSLLGNTAATGITYQWQDSVSGGAWTSISYANFATLNTNITADSWFRCIVGCSIQKDTSTVKAIILKNYFLCICNTNLGGGCSSSGAIDSTAIETTNLATSNTGCSTNNYMQYPISGTNYAQLTSGQNYNLHTRFNGNVIASVWIDYNQNGEFDKTEFTRICTTAKIDSDYVTVLSVPAGAKTGLTTMRIRSRGVGNANDSTDACTNFGSGETEDYFIGINYNIGIAQVKNVNTGIILYPNPVSNTLYIDGNYTINQQITLSLYSINGTFVTTLERIYNGKPIVMDVSSNENGIYFLKVSGKDFSIVKKVIINR